MTDYGPRFARWMNGRYAFHRGWLSLHPLNRYLYDDTEEGLD